MMYSFPMSISFIFTKWGTRAQPLPFTSEFIVGGWQSGLQSRRVLGLLSAQLHHPGPRAFPRQPGPGEHRRHDPPRANAAPPGGRAESRAGRGRPSDLPSRLVTPGPRHSPRGRHPSRGPRDTGATQAPLLRPVASHRPSRPGKPKGVRP
ncbi:translation initiation factor IF-2-like [Peromyscus leucopus]|uniref:translation initiation factor IF-2-like n=1 Tax=Peromyscus leucopus TaxID=10041 RepID=UPI001884EC9C|nr:translation initiation factor IF-2-like [Peromyscus leucopus]